MEYLKSLMLSMCYFKICLEQRDDDFEILMEIILDCAFELQKLEYIIQDWLIKIIEVDAIILKF